MPTRPSGADSSPTAAEFAAAVSGLRSVMLAVQEFRQAVATVLGLSLTDTFAISYLAADGPLTAGELSERMGMAASSVTAVLDRLERAGVVTRQRRADDRRAVTAVITESGREALDWAHSWMVAALRGMGEEQLPVVTDTLVRLAENLRIQADAIAAEAGHPR